MKRIVIDARESGTSTGRYIDKLIENLHKLKPDFEFVILAKSSRLDFFKNLVPDFKIKRCDVLEFSFAEQYSYVWKLYGIKNDLVHFGMTQQPVLYFGNKVTTIHDLTTARFRNPSKNFVIFKFKQIVYRLVIKFVAKKSAYVITVSEFVRQDLAKFAKIDPNKIIVTYEAADKITEKAEPVKKLAGKKFIMYVGRPQPHKNLWRLVEAFNILKENNPELKLILAGKKDVLYQRLEKKVAKAGISGVEFTGFVSEGQLRWLYENCRAYVFPSLSEGFGLPGLEAMIQGAPVVSSDATCLPEIYEDAALYFNPLDIHEMSRKINEVINDEKTREKLIAAGKKQAAKYSWRRMAEQTLEIYQRTLS